MRRTEKENPDFFPEGVSMVQPLSPEQLLEALNRQLTYVRANSPFYREHLPDTELTSLDRLSTLPFVTARDLSEDGQRMLCCPPKEIRRMVTMRTSGTTGKPKRLAFSQRDLRDTVSFFRDGMRLLCKRGDTVMIFMPGSRPDGLCRLLAEGIEAFGGIPVIYGVILDYQAAARVCRDRQAAVMVGVPAQIRRLALTAPDLRPVMVLLSADYLSSALAGSIERIWRCQVLNHYGLTESGLGCAVETPERRGMLVRRDIYLEVLPEGELALTTLRRQAMPLIRYRTGGLGRMLPDGRLGEIFGRKADLAPDACQSFGCGISVPLLDQILFAEDTVLDYQALRGTKGLQIKVAGGEAAKQAACDALDRAGFGISVRVTADEGVCSDGISKRRMIDQV